MWPDLAAPGAELGTFVTACLLAGLGGIIWFAMRNPRSSGPDPVADLWRRYEQGDLTSWEAARLFRLVAGEPVAVERAAHLSAPWQCAGAAGRRAESA